MKRFVVLAGLGASLAMTASFARGQEVETFDSPDTLQVNNSNFTFSPPIGGAWATQNGGTIHDNPTNVEITATKGYGTAYKSIYALDKPPAGASNGVVDISGSNALRLDVTINSGDAGLFVDFDDGEGDFIQYLYGYGLVGGAANNAPPQKPGETIAQGAAPNELILTIPLTSFNSSSGTFDFSQITDFRLEDDSGSIPAYDISFNDLSGVSTPEPASLGLLALGGLLFGQRRRA